MDKRAILDQVIAAQPRVGGANKAVANTKSYWVSQFSSLLDKYEEVINSLENFQDQQGVDAPKFKISSLQTFLQIRLDLAKSMLSNNSLLGKPQKLNAEEFERVYDLIVKPWDITIKEIDKSEKAARDKGNEIIQEARKNAIKPKLNLIK